MMPHRPLVTPLPVPFPLTTCLIRRLQQVLLRTMHDAGVSNMQELRAKLQELEAAAGSVVAATQESVAGKVLELRALTEGLRLHEELVRRMHELTSLAWCKAATATDGVRKRVDSRTSIDATIATELVLQRVETFKAEVRRGCVPAGTLALFWEAPKERELES